MERKLENELPVKGKFYKRIAETNPEFTKGTVYECITSGELIDDLGMPSTYFSEEVFSENYVEVIEEDKTTERKLENELPVKGKKYKRITGGSTVYNKGYTYICEEDCKLKNILWLNKDSFSQLFVEVIEEDKTKPISYENPWYKKMEEEITAERGYNRTLSKPLTMEEVKHLKELEENSETRFLFPETTGVKHDQNKLPLYTIIFKQFPLAIQAVAKRALAGHNKYIETDADWQNFARAGEQDPDRYKNAGLRHLLEEGEDKEEGMEGTTHEAAVVWNFLADLECKIKRENGENI